MAAATLAGCSYFDDDDSSGPATTAPAATSSPSTSTTPPDAEPPDDTEAVIRDLTEFVEAERGVTFAAPVAVELADDEEFERRILVDLEGDREALAKVEPRFRALGIIEPDTDLYEAFRTLLGAGVVGFYDPEKKELVVRGTELSLYGREVAVHELTHALDDEHFDIGDDVAAWSDDPGLAVLSAMEGSAERVRAAYAATLTAEEREESTREQLALVGDDIEALLALPRGLIDLLGVPYGRGLTFANQVEREGDLAAVDRTLRDDPPDSMEQILHPQAYLDGEPVVPVDAPTAEGSVVEEGVLGEHYLLALLGADAEDAVEGWGGDRYVTWRDGERSCLRVAVAADSADDRGELADAATAWAEDAERGATRNADAAGDLVTLTSCV